jgi:hypothetical protein
MPGRVVPEQAAPGLLQLPVGCLALPPDILEQRLHSA